MTTFFIVAVVSIGVFILARLVYQHSIRAIDYVYSFHYSDPHPFKPHLSARIVKNYDNYFRWTYKQCFPELV